MLLAQERPERARRLAPVGLGQERSLLAPGELAAWPDREDLRVPVRCAREGTRGSVMELFDDECPYCLT